MDHAPLPLGSPGEPRCPDPRPELADPRQPPVTQAPRGTWRGSSSCYSRARPSHLLLLLPHAFASPGRSLLLRGPGPPPGCGGPVGSGTAVEVLRSQQLWELDPTAEPLSHSLASTCLPWVPCSAARETGGFGGRGTGPLWGNGVGPDGSGRQRARWLPRFQFDVPGSACPPSQSQPSS